jgi:branched-chain amino acid transport system ATP-binding protein
MVAIGRALLRDPVLLLLDEPSEGLAPKLVNEVGDALVRLRESGLALLLVEQNLALATRVAQRVYVMNKGTIVFAGTPAELAADRDVETRYLGV